MKYIFFLIFVLTAMLPYVINAADNPGGPASPLQTPLDADTGNCTPSSVISNFYVLGLSVVGISALFMMVWGGIIYIYAGDNASKVEEGRKKVRNALIGIFVAGISYAILNTINPDLVHLRLTLPSTSSTCTQNNTGGPPT